MPNFGNDNLGWGWVDELRFTEHVGHADGLNFWGCAQTLISCDHSLTVTHRVSAAMTLPKGMISFLWSFTARPSA
eukprot:4376983-Amphidinium_carterae.1